MSSSYKTNYLGLNRFVGTDHPKMEDVNFDNQTIDAKFQEHIESKLHITEEERQQLGVPTGGEGVAVRFVDELIGAYQLLPRPEEGVGEIGWYGLLPQWQGRDQGIQPLGQIIQRCRHMGLLRLRLRCGDDRQRSFWEKLGFSPVGGDVMEKDITPRVLDAHIPL